MNPQHVDSNITYFPNQTLYFDRQGKPMSLEDWGQSFELRTRIIGQKHLGGLFVSTVWLGLNHNWGDGPPLIFETMVFNYWRGHGTRFGIVGEDVYMRRYSTEEEAYRGHKEALRLATIIYEKRMGRRRGRKRRGGRHV